MIDKPNNSKVVSFAKKIIILDIGDSQSQTVASEPLSDMKFALLVYL